MTTGVILALCRVHQLIEVPGNVGVSAIDKRPVDGPVHVRRLGLHGDIQADREHHGGVDKAVYAYASEESSVWEVELGHPITPGFFGENLHLSGIDVSGAIIGERWLVGSEVELEVTMPRIPCSSFQHRVERTRWIRQFADRGLPGAYLRVLTMGTIKAGDSVTVTHRPDHGVTVSSWITNASLGSAKLLLDEHHEGRLFLGPNMLGKVQQVLGRGRAAMGGSSAPFPPVPKVTGNTEPSRPQNRVE
ncbi:MOSC domain-containing protein [Arthrobacter roseus]|uniref:MOSC domain-containing protein n=1 Tax=Arthrobacter roseus TaxID=136274 RepID=UPI001964DFDB|nr:MOSC domain-containing protein [Arthrobacter roseus]MBM7849387.1 MOSC domain-containing protein YiiM [Arthrobacter roseus]